MREEMQTDEEGQSRPGGADSLPVRTTLPRQISSFIGREAERAEVTRRLRETRLLTLTGPGGIGKTRLALEVVSSLSSQFEHGVLVVELAPITSPAGVPGALAAVLGVADAAGQSYTETLVRAIGDRSALLVLDNCEHLIAPSAELAEALLRGCPHLRIIATSREPLDIPGEVVWVVPPLSVPSVERQAQGVESTTAESVELFLARARAVQPTFDPSGDDRYSAGEICRRLDGIPLAIELAAARIRMLSPGQVLERLDDRFHLLTGGRRTAPPRQQTLAATIDWSYQLLNEAERALFRRLAVFAGGWSLEAAEEICAHSQLLSSEIMDLLASLVDKSLVTIDGRRGEIRYRYLDSLHAFALARLRESGEEELSRSRHQAWYFRKLAEAGGEVFGPRHRAWLLWMDQEIDNVRVALDWCAESPDRVVEALDRCTPALRFYWDVRGHTGEAVVRLSALLAHESAALTPGGRAQTLAYLARSRMVRGQFDQAVAEFHQAVEVARSTADPVILAQTLFEQAGLFLAMGELDAAEGRCQEVLQLGGVTVHPYSLTGALYCLGEIACQRGDLSEARRFLEECTALTRTFGDTREWGFVIASRGHLAYLCGDMAEARHSLLESLRVAGEIRDALIIQASLDVLASVDIALGDLERATILLGASQAVMETTGWGQFPWWLTDKNHALEVSRAQLGQERWTRLFEEGHRLPLEEALLRAAQENLPSPQRLAASGVLSRRESQVVALIGQGLRNREIAERLVVGERAVEQHVTHALNKLGFSSRSQLAVWAAEHGLLVHPTD